MQQEGEEKDERLAREIHRKLNLVDNSTGARASSSTGAAAESDEEMARRLQEQLNRGSPIVTPSEVTPSSSTSTETDEEMARRLQEELNREDDENTANDALLAAMLQNQIDTERMAEEKHRNGNAKVTMSSFRGTQYRDQDMDEFSEDEEESFYEVPEVVSDPSRTKHDKAANMARNQKKITDTFNIEFNTGDFTGIKVPHKVYNELQVEAHKSKFDGVRVKDRRDISTHEKVLDKRTRVVMLKMLNSGIVNKINGIISTGKESVIIHCNGGRLPGLGNESIPVPAECVFKIHKTSLNEFRRRREYLDDRYTKVVNNRTKKLIEVWAMKEVNNLNRLRRAGILCPEVVAHRKQLLLLSFIGSNGVPAPTLHDAAFSSDQLKSAYQQLLSGMMAMHSKSKLVHADLSEYNLLWSNGVLHFIDLSQAVLTDHPSALTYLYRDCTNMYKYFHSRGLKNVADPRKMFCHVTGLEVEYTDEATFVARIEHLQRKEIKDFKHGSTATDYAFETSFQETILLSDSDSEEEEEEEEEARGEESQQEGDRGEESLQGNAEPCSSTGQE
ncbi:serine/threonine-protein kinase RIO3-like isoform X2 [Bolinopsis microptera]|uniref:serine/threonine-protein kinase RIO3-like isoform X1 n=1 Tax=Bolinopsis microptera TaxID=2820187 RepID=UPI00307A57D6